MAWPDSCGKGEGAMEAFAMLLNLYLCDICTFRCQIFASLCIQGASDLDALFHVNRFASG